MASTPDEKKSSSGKFFVSTPSTKIDLAWFIRQITPIDIE